MRYCLCMKNNNPRIIHERFDAEFADNTKWTRARVEVKIGSAVIFALRMDKNNTTELIKKHFQSEMENGKWKT